MSKLARTLVLGAMLAAMNLAGMTAVAQAQPNDPDGKKPGGRPPRAKWGRPGASIQITSQQQTAADAASSSSVAASWHHRRMTTPSGTPAQVPAPSQAAEPSGQPGWLVPSLAVLAAALACPVDWP